MPGYRSQGTQQISGAATSAASGRAAGTAAKATAGGVTGPLREHVGKSWKVMESLDFPWSSWSQLQTCEFLLFSSLVSPWDLLSATISPVTGARSAPLAVACSSRSHGRVACQREGSTCLVLPCLVSFFQPM